MKLEKILNYAKKIAYHQYYTIDDIVPHEINK